MARWNLRHVICRDKFVCMLRSVAPFFFLAEVPILDFFYKERGVAI